MDAPRSRNRFRRRWLLLLLVPPALWSLVLLIVPTEWARARLAHRLARASGKRVTIGALRLGPLGGVRLRDLAIGEPETTADAWLKVREIRMNLHLVNLLFPPCQPSRVEAVGIDLRIHRRKDGSWEWGNLLAPAPHQTAGTSGEGRRPSGCVVEFHVLGGKLHLLDESSQTRLDFDQLDCQGTWEFDRAAIQALHATLGEGELQLAAQRSKQVGATLYEGQARLHNIKLQGSMGALGYLLPLLAETPDSVDGTLDLDLYLKTEGSTPAELRAALFGRGSLAVDGVSLDGSRVIGELTRALDLPSKARIGSIKSRFTIGQGRVTSDPLAFQIGQIPVVMAGWTSFDGRLDFRVQHEGLSRRLPQEARNLLADLPIDLDNLASLRVQGTLDDLKVSFDGAPNRPAGAGGDGARHADQRLRLREFGRRLRNRILK